MPICPGCEQTVPYERLCAHQQYCPEIRRSVTESPSVEALDRRLASLEKRVHRRIGTIESDVERRLLRIEAAQHDLDETTESDQLETESDQLE